MKKLSILPVMAVFLAAAAGAGCTQFFKYPDSVGPEDGVTDSDDDGGDAQTDTQDDDAEDVRTDDAGGDDQPGDAADVQADDTADVEVEPDECGDGNKDDGEECDDGNDIAGDGCENDCMYSCHEETQEIECDDLLGCTLDACNTSSHTCDHHTMVDGTTCRPAADLCDAVETCNGTDTACPSDGFEPDTHVCREADGDCDAAETCTGSSVTCPEDGYLDNTFECREEAGDCDLPENCPGDGPDCTADQFLAHTVQCRASAGVCDTAENCTGSSAACPANAFLPDTTQCRASAGACDIAENCTGGGADCPANAFRPDTFECRADAGECDITENCPGNGAACPENLFVDSGEDCEDDDDCTVDTECDGDGNCAGTHLTELVNVAGAAMGDNHVCALLSSGIMKCWGSNDRGQLGDGSMTDRLTPVVVPGLASAPASIGAGGSHTCAVLDTGAVQCWGANGSGQLGDGSTSDKIFPIDVTGLSTGVTDVSAGYGHTCALLTGGGVKCWGDGDYGQMGNGATADQTTPVDVTGLGSASVISAGRYHTCALVSGGVKCWGRNGNGQLGNGLTENSSTPVDVTGLGSGVSAVSAGSDHTCARLDSGAMKCWGRGATGRLGDGSGDQHETPVDVSGMGSSVTSIGAGAAHTCAIHSTEGVKCWGWNYRGEVGDGTDMTRMTPVSVYNMGAGTADRIFTGTDATCAIMASTNLKCWGNNNFGQLGIGATSRITTPTTVAGLSATVTMAGAGDGSSCAANSDGFYCWGSNEWWLLADGIQLNTTAPTSVTGLSTHVIDFDGTYEHVCVVNDVDGDARGAALCWGRNHRGQLGDGTTQDRSSPTQVAGLTDHVRSISPGSYHSCALVDTDGDTIGGVKCWGDNGWGQVGDGSGTERYSPVNVSGLTEADGVLDVQSGHVHSCALTDEGGVKCWGYGNDGRIGNGSTDHQFSPVDVTGLTSGVSAIAVGEAHACALLTTGQVLCWGQGTSGQLGTGSTTSSSVPVQPWGYDSGIASIEAGNDHNCAILDTGAVQCWGQNSGGQVGDGTTWRRDYPVDVVGLPETPAAIAAGVDHTCARFSTGSVMCWGEDYAGETTGFFPGYPRFVSCD